MVFKINIQARIKRHSRIIKHSLTQGLKDKNYYSYGYNFVIFVVIFLLPIYPALATFVHDNTLVDFYRGNIDESSILESYIWSDSDWVIAESKNAYLSVNSLLDDTRDLSWVNEIISYKIKEGDSVSWIASKFQVTNNSILWANNLTENSVLKPGLIVSIPPVSGLIHKVKSGETLSVIAKKYGVDESVIRRQNGLGLADVVVKDTSLVIPGAEKTLVIPDAEKTFTDDIIAVKTTVKTKTKTKTNKQKSYTFARYANVSESALQDWGNSDTGGDDYILKRQKVQHSFAWGNCTWFVAQYKNVDWGGNAKDWVSNATDAGHATGKTPKAGAIVVFYGSGYNPRYGHVGIVTSVKWDTIIVKEMNFRRLNEVTVRRVAQNERAILWYIYVN